MNVSNKKWIKQLTGWCFLNEVFCFSLKQISMHLLFFFSFDANEKGNFVQYKMKNL